MKIRTLTNRQGVTGRLKAWFALAVVSIAMVALAACGGDGVSSSAADKQAIGEANKSVVSRFIEEFKNNANIDVVDELFRAGNNLPRRACRYAVRLKMPFQRANQKTQQLMQSPSDRLRNPLSKRAIRRNEFVDHWSD